MNTDLNYQYTMNLLGQCCTAAKESNYYDQQITCQNDIKMICCSAWCHVLNVYFCPSNIFQLPFKVAIGAKHAQLSYLNQHILELQPILGTLWGCFSLHNQPTSPPTIRIIGHVALNQRLIKIRNHLKLRTLWIEPSAKILTIRIQVTCMAGILETVMLQPCSFSMNVYDTQHHTTPTSLWDQSCWNSSVLDFFVELHNTLPGIYTTRLMPGKRTPQKKHTHRQILGGPHHYMHPSP